MLHIKSNRLWIKSIQLIKQAQVHFRSNLSTKHAGDIPRNLINLINKNIRKGTVRTHIANLLFEAHHYLRKPSTKFAKINANNKQCH